MPQIEIFVDIFGSDGIPHTFIKVYDNEGNATEYGFRPENGKLIDDGHIDINIDHEYNSSSGRMDITNEQYEDLIDSIKESIANPPEYNLFTGKTCTSWVLNMLNEADIIPGSLANNTWFTTIFDTLIFNPYLQYIGFKINDLLSASFNASQAWIQRYDPLTLDLDGDGIETVAASTTNPILFDHDGDGVKTGTGWIKSDDGFLVMDRNNNGTIDNGTELFGDSTPLNSGGTTEDGFAALAQEDTNADGVVNNQDTNWSNLCVWQDLRRLLKSAHMLCCAATAGVATYIKSTSHFFGYARLASERI